MMGRTRRSTAAIALVALLGATSLTACSSWPPWRRQAFGTGYSQQELYEDLARHASHVSAVIAAAAEQIQDETTSRRVRRSTLVWQLRMAGAVHNTAFHDDVQTAYVESLALAIIHRNYLNVGDGREVFGEQQPIAVATAELVERSALEIGDRFLGPERLAKLVGQLEELALEFPMRGRDFNLDRARIASQRIESKGFGFEWALSIPMAPFHALEGVGSTPSAVLEINRTAIEFSRVVEELPRQNRLQIELLLFDVEERETVAASRLFMEQVGASAERLSAAVERFPQDLNALLADSEPAVAQVAQTLQTAERLMGPLTKAVSEIARVSDQISDMQSSRGGAESGQGFDLLAVETTSRQIEASASELSALIERLDALLEGGRLDGAIALTIQETERKADALVGRVRLALIQVLLVFFGLLLVYRWVSSRIGARAT